MALTSIGAIYATNSLLLQRIYVPDVDDAEITRQFVAAGEKVLMIPLATYIQGGVPAVQAAIGKPSHSGRCAIVANNVVIDHVLAEPVLYSDPRGQVIQHDTSNIGDTWDGTQFTRKYNELDATTGVVVGSSTQPILSAVPQINAANYLISAAIDPIATIGSSVPGVSAQIAGRASPTVS